MRRVWYFSNFIRSKPHPEPHQKIFHCEGPEAPYAEIPYSGMLRHGYQEKALKNKKLGLNITFISYMHFITFNNTKLKKNFN